MTGLDAMKQAVATWYATKDLSDNPPEFVKKLCHVIYRLRREVFNLKTGEWESEGF